jgi:beta-glucosidase
MKDLSTATETGNTPEGIATNVEIRAEVERLLSELTLKDKIQMMSGDGSLWRDGPRMLRAYNMRPIPAGAGIHPRIPGLRFTDGPRGVVMNHATCFPVSMARGASWDIDLEERIGEAMGVEARALGANFFAGVCVNLLRHPAWGRAQETYGEDPHHLGEMGAALVRGVQRHVMACVKHFACNSIENARFKVDVRVEERPLREVYLPHFKRCVDEGVAAVMSAYNKVNGEWCSQNALLLREILKGEWGFKGFVISDFVFGVHDGERAALSGLDIEMPFTEHYGKKLHRSVGRGTVPESVIDEAVARILTQQLRFMELEKQSHQDERCVACEAHTALAREAAGKSIVLLKNDPPPGGSSPLLPLDPDELKRILLIGELARVENTGDRGSSEVRAPYVVTPRDGFQAAQRELGFDLEFDDGADIQRAAGAARRADVCAIVVGYTHKDEGEYIEQLWLRKGGDRDSLQLKEHDEALIRAVSAANASTVVVMIGGSAVITESWREAVPAILMAWYPGMEGGNALVDVLFGTINPSAKLPCVFPKSEAQLPHFNKEADSIVYDSYHGYRLMDREGEHPAFAYGFGLSYTTFQYSDLMLDRPVITGDGNLAVTIQVSNTGSRAGEEIVQLYVGCEEPGVDRPVKELKGFNKVALEPGQRRLVKFAIPARSLATYNPDNSSWSIEEGVYRVYAGGSSREEDLSSARFQIVGGGNN